MKKAFFIIGLIISIGLFTGCPGPHDSVDNNSLLLGTWTVSTWFSLEFDNSRKVTIINSPPSGQENLMFVGKGTYSYTDTTVTFHNIKYQPYSEKWDNDTWTMDYRIVNENYYGMDGQVLYLYQGNHRQGRLSGNTARLFKNNN